MKRGAFVAAVAVSLVFGAAAYAIHVVTAPPAFVPPPAFSSSFADPKPATVTKATAPVAAIHGYGLPVRLLIPKLKVDAKMLYMGKTAAGNMQVPGNVVDAGWYKYGALPGNTGTAVIAGHLDGLKAEPGVFSNLKQLQVGDVVSVRDNAGATVSFSVRALKSYGQNDQPAEVFSSTSGSHLNLITCTGAWDKTAHQFAQRLVVFTDRI
ncbi:MAG: class F sortase [Patescibacteria group bacterium]|nr:class F sortase [Patescibacteria group bacterium]